MSHAMIDQIAASQMRSDRPRMDVGDTVDVHVRIIEGAKERIQVFSGVIIGRSGKGLEDSITVRRIVANEGVERIFPVHSPRVAAIEVKRHGHVRRSKLYYLRERVGKKRRLRDRRRGLGQLVRDAEAREAEAQAQAAANAAQADQPQADEKAE